jgi:predicted neutral ceramidase superfamily lipid hydrolase
VFIALCLKLLPNGLIGVFLAAMLAATMSTLSSVYNMVSSILSRDIYQGWIRPNTTDTQLLTVGRLFSIGLGLFVVIMAVIFVNSQFGIFNLMQAFFTLLNIPVVVPVAFGLIFRRVPKWAAVGAIAWGLVVGIITRWVLGWDIGPQVYIEFVSSFGIFVLSNTVGDLYRNNRLLLMVVCVAVFASFAAVFILPTTPDSFQMTIALVGAALLGGSLYGFSALFSKETPEQRKVVAEFFKKLDTPVDVAKEVFAAGRKQISTFPLVGGTTIVMGGLLSMIFLTDISVTEQKTLGTIIAIMVVFGALMWYFGKKSEIRSASQYEKSSGGTHPKA